MPVSVKKSQIPCPELAVPARSAKTRLVGGAIKHPLKIRLGGLRGKLAVAKPLRHRLATLFCADFSRFPLQTALISVELCKVRIRLRHRRLAALLAKSRRSQNAWAAKMGLSPGHLSRLVNGRRRYPSPKTRERILKGLGLPFEELFEIECGQPRRPVSSHPHRSSDGKERWSSMFVQDLHFALRVLGRRRLSTALCVAVLGIGFTAAISVFSVVRQVVLSPLPYPDSDRLVMVLSRYRNGALTAVSPLVFRDFQERSRSLELVGAYSTEPVHLLSGGEPERIVAASISADMAAVLGMQTVLGRVFEKTEMVAGQDQVVIVSHRLWRNRFGGDPTIVGGTVDINDARRVVVGVASPDFRFPEPVDLFVPLALPNIWYEESRRGWEFLTVVGRRSSGIGPDEASRELSGILAEVAPARAAKGQGAEAMDLQKRLLGERRPALLTLFLSASILALMAWFNVANLMLARAESRFAEFSLRLALGSNRSGLFKLLVLESSLLGLCGGIFGTLASSVVLAVLKTPLQEYLALAGRVETPWTVGLAASGVSVLTGALFGIIPAARVSAIPLAVSLNNIGRGGLGAPGTLWRKGLVGLQVAVSVCLLIAVSALTISLGRLDRVNPGFDPNHLLSLRLELPQSRYTIPQRGQFHSRLLEQARALPGVIDAALTYTLPLTGRVWTASFDIEGQDPVPAGPEPGGNFRPVSVDYFATLRIPLLQGRLFNSTDTAASPLVAIVDEAMARQFWPGRSPVGHRLLDIAGDKPVTVVGVVGSVKDVGLHVESNGHLYFPLAQRPDIRQFNLVVRTGLADPLSLAPALTERIHDLDPLLPIFGVSTVDQQVSATLRDYRQGVALVTLFGVVAVVLAAAGIYSVASYGVARRTSELGIRLALGARGRHVLGMILTDTLKMALPGVAAGIATAFFFSRSFQSFIFGVEPADWRIVGPVAGLMLGVALLAGLQPALKASRTDCIKAIRCE